jgi:hypothetical protein
VGSFESVKVFALRSPAHRVHEAVTHPESWLACCGLLRELRRVQQGRPDGLGARHRAVLVVPAGYTIAWELETVRSVPGAVVEWAATGDLEGSGLWELDEVAGVTRVTNTWRVRPTQPWMARLSSLAQGVVAHEHDVLMRQGVQALAAQIGGEVVGEASGHRHAVLGRRGASTLAVAAGAALRRGSQHA